MKTAIILSSMILALTIGSCNNPTTKKTAETEKTTPIAQLDTTKLKSGAVFYQCKMDREVITDKPGTCPKCGMTLEKEIKK